MGSRPGQKMDSIAKFLKGKGGSTMIELGVFGMMLQLKWWWGVGDWEEWRGWGVAETCVHLANVRLDLPPTESVGGKSVSYV